MKNILFVLFGLLFGVSFTSCKKEVEEKPKHYAYFTLAGEEKIIYSENYPSGSDAYISYPINEPTKYVLSLKFSTYQININYLKKAEFFFHSSPTVKTGGSGNVNLIFNGDNTFSGTFGGILDNGKMIDKGQFNNIKYKN